MKFPRMEKGTYKVSDAVTVTCSCGNKVSFIEGEVFKFCSNCGEKINKMRAGTSSYTYSGVMSDALKRVVSESQEFFFEMDVVSNGPGHRQYGIRKYHSPDVSAYIDASKGKVSMKSISISIDVYTDAEGNVWSSGIKQETYNKISLEFSDEEIFKLTEEDVTKKLMHKAKGLWSKVITKENYEKRVAHLWNITLSEVSDLYSDTRARKKDKLYIPKGMDDKIAVFSKDWHKVNKECADRNIRTNFTLLAPVTIKRHIEKTGDAIVLTVHNAKGDDETIMYSDIIAGKYGSLNDFEFTSDNKEFKVIINKKEDNG